ncbi:MAG TPA: crossover junction endodeoxyribonuclease RuvC [Rickettsiales bacterium]|nr:crossover junction endodeoxyribonuclease RuvC [Rickettsiales bacterium]
MKSKRIIGIDPALTKAGWGVIEVNGNSFKFVACGLIKTDASLELTKRLYHLHQELIAAIKFYKPHEAAIEETFINMNPTSSLKLGHARGALMLTLGLCELSVFEYSTTSIKKSVVGVGRAEKQQIQAMIKILLPNNKVQSEDEADALATAICHVNNFRKYK